MKTFERTTIELFQLSESCDHCSLWHNLGFLVNVLVVDLLFLFDLQDRGGFSLKGGRFYFQSHL